MHARLYLLVRDDLPYEQKVVQGCHAVAAWCFKYPGHKWKEEKTLVVTVISSEKELEMIWLEVRMRGYKCAMFREPDMDNSLTAVAWYSEDNFGSSFKLL